MTPISTARRVGDVLLAFLCELVGLLSIPIVPIAVAFASRDRTATQGSWAGGPVELVGPAVCRGDLPRFFSWLSTPDERLPGGLYEPAVRANYERFGFYLCSVLWLWRNRAYGFGWLFAKPALAYLDAIDGVTTYAPGFWRWQRDMGPVRVGCGWKVQCKTVAKAGGGDELIAVPYISIRKKPKR